MRNKCRKKGRHSLSGQKVPCRSIGLAELLMKKICLCALVLCVLGAGSVSGTEFSPSSEGASSGGQPPSVRQDGEESREDREEAPEEEKGIVRGTIEKGDTVSKILGNVAQKGVQAYIVAMEKVFSARAFRDGQPYLVATDPASGQLTRFEYEIDSRRRLVVEGTDAPEARVEAIDYTVLLASVSAVLGDSLFQTVADMGESPQIALSLAGIFASEINFIRDIQAGDSFSLLVEKRYRDGEYRGYGRILAAHFTCKGKTFEAYLFRDGDGPANYYNQKGENLRKSFLQAPLAFTRITSRFSHSRKHPILGYSRPHPGVDYAAPTGTPVKAVGEGVVAQRGWSGGYGNQVIVRHPGGLESMYSHLSGYARGLKKGQKVRQGEVIGFVGSTGLSTGPHLDFRLRQNGTFINPATAVNPRGAPVSAKAREAFEKTMQRELALLKGLEPLSPYTVESIVPDVVFAPARNEKADETERRKKKKSGKARAS